jgi:hypothetical protein
VNHADHVAPLARGVTQGEGSTWADLGAGSGAFVTVDPKENRSGSHSEANREDDKEGKGQDRSEVHDLPGLRERTWTVQGHLKHNKKHHGGRTPEVK